MDFSAGLRTSALAGVKIGLAVSLAELKHQNLLKINGQYLGPVINVVLLY